MYGVWPALSSARISGARLANKLNPPSGSPRTPIAALLCHFEAGSLASGYAKRYFLASQVTFFTGLIREGGMTMPAKEAPGVLLSAEPSPTHTWSKPHGRRLELEPGKPLIQWSCTTCQRHFVNQPATGTPPFLAFWISSDWTASASNG
jgi:hypothetical protein